MVIDDDFDQTIHALQRELYRVPARAVREDRIFRTAWGKLMANNALNTLAPVNRLTITFLAISPGPDQPPVSIRFLERPAHWVHPLL